METLFIFIAKSSGLLALFYLAYYFLLRKETFFNSNRWFLLAGLITSVVLPLLVYTKVILVAPIPITTDTLLPTYIPQDAIQEGVFEINRNYVLLTIYIIGLAFLLMKFAYDFYCINLVLKGKKIKQQADFKFIDINENIAPFSYFDYIVYNSTMFSAEELENIIEHEKVHSEQNHTIDVLISRVFCVLFWFNPIMWLYKKAIVQNLEFIADHEAAKKISDKKAYQYTLLKITTHKNCLTITNHFYQSLIKKRIVMLNKNQSKKRNSWKYYVVVPALAAFVLLFQIEVIAKERQQIVKEVSGEPKSVDVYKIRKNSTDADLKEIKEKLKANHDVDFEVSEIKRNSDNDLTSIKVNLTRGKQQTQSIQTEGNHTIKDFGVVITTEKNGNKSIGIQTSEEINDSKISKEPKKASSKKLQTNGNNNFNVSTKTNSNTNTNISTIVTTDTDTNNNTITRITTNNEGSNIVISNSNKVNYTGEKLVIVDGVEMPSTFNFDNIKSSDIKSMNVYKGEMATDKFGEKGKNGVIEIITKSVIEKNKFNDSQGKIAQGQSVVQINTNEKSLIITNQKKGDNSVITSTTKTKIKTKGSKSKAQLIIVDGKIITDKNYNLDSLDIEKMEILKGQDAVSKYGDKGKNGVIVITTRK